LNDFMLDTNIIMSDPYIFNKLDGECFISETVLSELDKHKTRNDEIGRNIREFARNMATDKYDNVQVVPWTLIKTESNDVNIILASEHYKTTLLTNDNLMFCLAQAKNADSKLLKLDQKSEKTDELYSGIVKTDLSSTEFALDLKIPRNPNEYVLANNGLHKVSNNKIKRIKKDIKVWNISHKNLEQRCALDALMNPDIKLVTITGKAGSGKTLISVASMLEQSLNSREYDKMLIARPIVPMGNDIGYLPGDVNEKLGPWLQPIFDNMEVLLGNKKGNSWEELIEAGMLEVGALTYIRGRSIPNQIILIDEAQNLTKHEIITILTRVGEGTKIILTGDVEQIDSTKLDSINNGLSYVIGKFKDQSISAHITLTKCERSELADISCKIL